MASKLDKMMGVARTAYRRFEWKGFTLQPGCAYGRDADGALFASFGVRSDRFGIPEAKKHHIIVFRCVNEKTISMPKHHKTFWGANSRAIGRRPILMEAGKYAAPWGYVWQWEQIPYWSPLAKEIFRAIEAHHRGKKTK